MADITGIPLISGFNLSGKELIDKRSGPYSSKAEALLAIKANQRAIALYVFVAINPVLDSNTGIIIGADSIDSYWFEKGLNDADLVLQPIYNNIIQPNIAYVATYGDNGTAVVGDITKPFSGFSAAATAVYGTGSSVTNGIVYILKGNYTSTWQFDNGGGVYKSDLQNVNIIIEPSVTCISLKIAKLNQTIPINVIVSAKNVKIKGFYVELDSTIDSTINATFDSIGENFNNTAVSLVNTGTGKSIVHLTANLVTLSDGVSLQLIRTTSAVATSEYYLNIKDIRVPNNSFGAFKITNGNIILNSGGSFTEAAKATVYQWSPFDIGTWSGTLTIFDYGVAPAPLNGGTLIFMGNANANFNCNLTFNLFSENRTCIDFNKWQSINSTYSNFITGKLESVNKPAILWDKPLQKGTLQDVIVISHNDSPIQGARCDMKGSNITLISHSAQFALLMTSTGSILNVTNMIILATNAISFAPTTPITLGMLVTDGVVQGVSITGLDNTLIGPINFPKVIGNENQMLKLDAAKKLIWADYTALPTLGAAGTRLIVNQAGTGLIWDGSVRVKTGNVAGIIIGGNTDLLNKALSGRNVILGNNSLTSPASVGVSNTVIGNISLAKAAMTVGDCNILFIHNSNGSNASAASNVGSHNHYFNGYGGPHKWSGSWNICIGQSTYHPSTFNGVIAFGVGLVPNKNNQLLIGNNVNNVYGASTPLIDGDMKNFKLKVNGVFSIAGGKAAETIIFPIGAGTIGQILKLSADSKTLVWATDAGDTKAYLENNTDLEHINLGQIKILKGSSDKLIISKQEKAANEYIESVVVGTGGIGYNTAGFTFSKVVFLGLGIAMHSTANIIEGVFIGYGAGKEYKGNSVTLGGGGNIAIGNDSGYGNNGSLNIAIGRHNALMIGDRNICITSKSGSTVNVTKQITGDNNLHLGYHNEANNFSGSDTLRIGKQNFSLINGNFNGKTLQANGKLSIAGASDGIDTIIFPEVAGAVGQVLQLSSDGVTLEWIDVPTPTPTVAPFYMRVRSASLPVFVNVEGGTIFINQIGTDYYEVTSHDPITRVKFAGTKTDITEVDFQSATHLTSMYQFATSLTNMHTFNCAFEVTSNVTTMYQAFMADSSLTDFPLIDTSKVTNFERAFNNLVAITTFPLIDVSSSTSLVYTWSGCTNLNTFPVINVATITVFEGTWLNNNALTVFPTLNFSNATTLKGTFNGLNSLTSFPVIVIPNVTNLEDAWKGCNSLTSFPVLLIPSVTTIDGAWMNCLFSSFPNINFSSVQTAQSAWHNNTNLVCFVNLDFSSLVNGVDTFAQCDSLIQPAIGSSVRPTATTSASGTWTNGNACPPVLLVMQDRHGNDMQDINGNDMENNS